MSHIWKITAEPTGEVYQDLLKLAAKRCASFLLVQRYSLSFGRDAKQVTQQLAPYLISEKEGKSWPSTTLLKGLGILRYYQISPESMAILAEATGLYDWMRGRRPEDLTFYRADGQVWLWSSAHERFSHLEDTQLTDEKLRRAVPNLQFTAWHITAG